MFYEEKILFTIHVMIYNDFVEAYAFRRATSSIGCLKVPVCCHTTRTIESINMAIEAKLMKHAMKILSMNLMIDR
jgi:hypothetical protein